MQNLILITLILGLGFFLYLIKTGEINQEDFNIRKLQGPARFEIQTTQVTPLQKSSKLFLDIKDAKYDIYTFTGSELNRIPRSEYYKKQYNIPLEAKDAVTGTWLGSRYTFYVIEESIGGSEFNLEYHVYKTENTLDSQEEVEYTRIKTIRGLDISNRLEVKY